MRARAGFRVTRSATQDGNPQSSAETPYPGAPGTWAEVRATSGKPPECRRGRRAGGLRALRRPCADDSLAASRRRASRQGEAARTRGNIESSSHEFSVMKVTRHSSNGYRKDPGTEVRLPGPRSPRAEADPLKGSPVSVRTRPGALNDSQGYCTRSCICICSSQFHSHTRMHFAYF